VLKFVSFAKIGKGAEARSFIVVLEVDINSSC